MANLTQPQRRYDLAQSMFGQAVAPTRNAGAIEGIAKILQAYFASRGMRGAEQQERDIIKKDKDDLALAMDRGLGAYRGDTPYQMGEDELFPGEQPIQGLRNKGAGSNVGALAESMLTSGRKELMPVALQTLMSQPKDETDKKIKAFQQAKSMGLLGPEVTFEQFIKLGTPSTSFSNINLPTGMMPNPGYDPSKPISLENSPAVVVPGSKLDLDQQSAEAKREKERTEAEAAAKKAAQKDQTVLSGIENTINTIDEAIGEADWNATGLLGKGLGVIPGTDAYKLANKVLTIKANVGFDKLQQMRDLSPTGGALGQVAVQELAALQSVIASLEPGLGADELVKSFNKVKTHYTRWKATLADDLPDEAAGFGDITDDGLEVFDLDGSLIGYYE